MDFEFDIGSNQSSSSTFTTESGYISELFSTFCSSPGNSFVDSKALVTPEKTGPPVVGSRKRKNFIPQKGSYLNDPNFRGVTITMQNQLIDGEWKLNITPTFSLSRRRKRIFKPYTDSSEDEEISNNYTSGYEERLWLVKKKTVDFTEKHCASCSAKKTPLWRDAEDGTPLCNACGIRYKKYRMRCATCWHIPKKDEFHPLCRTCGSPYVSPRR